MEHGQSLKAAHYRVAQYYLDYLRSAQKAFLQGNESAAYALSLFDQEREQVKQWQMWAETHSIQDTRAALFCSDYAQVCPDLFRLRLHPLPATFLSKHCLFVVLLVCRKRWEPVYTGQVKWRWFKITCPKLATILSKVLPLPVL